MSEHHNLHDFTSSEWSYKTFSDAADSALKTLETADYSKMWYLIDRYGGGLSRKELDHLLKVGPFIPVDSNDSLANTRQVTIWSDNKIPHFAFIGLPFRDANGYVFYFIQRINKLPPRIKNTGPGIPYVMNRIWRDDKDRLDQDAVHATIDQDGNVYPCAVLMTKRLRVGKPARQVWLTQRYWTLELKPIENEWPVEQCFCWCLNLWQVRNFFHNAFVERAGRRCNFVIDIPSMKTIFSQRRFEPTKTGRRKPIAHWVSSHYRVYKQKKKWWQRIVFFWKKPKEKTSTVKTHLRGSKSFWIKDIFVVIWTPGHELDLVDMNMLVCQKYFDTEKREVVPGYDKLKPVYYQGPINGN